jgi:membrane protein DedA with SNARE-associated domain
MTETIHFLVEKYGLIAVFLGCMAEGESAAVLAGFFAHQRVFVPWQALSVAFLGAFFGDTLLFFLGRRFSNHPFVLRLKKKPGFSHAHRLVVRYPNLFVFFNRYAYGMRMIGGVAAGLSGIRVAKFLFLNALSSLVWASLFGSLGFVFGLGAERLLGEALVAHQRLIAAAILGIIGFFISFELVRHTIKRWRKAGE